MKKILAEEIAKHIPAEAGVAPSDIHLEHPAEKKHGDYSTNIALVLGKKLRRAPRDLAEHLRAALAAHPPKYVEKVEVAGPGFVNFTLTRDFFAAQTQNILDAGDRFGNTDALAGRRIMIEHTNPNLFKEFHIGHMMGNAIGESIARIMQKNGAEVIRANYQSDVGMNVAKTIWGMRRARRDTASVSDLGKAYAAGARAFEDDEGARAEIVEINKRIYGRSDEHINALYEKGREISLNYFKRIFDLLGTEYDYYFFESEVWEEGKKIVEEHTGTVFRKSDGAVVFPGESHGLHTRVFINSEGIPTYEAKEIGLTKKKFDLFPNLDASLIVSAHEQSDYFAVVIKAIELVFPELAGKIKHIPYGMLRFREGKMSSRKGNVISAEDVIARVRDMIVEKMKRANHSAGREDEVAQPMAIGAIKYSILRQSPGKNIVFDFETSISTDGDSGPYLQYSHARAVSVLNKAKEENISPEVGHSGATEEIESLLYRFPEIIESAYREYAPNHITTYLIELSSAFNSFYANTKIADKTNPLSAHHIAVTQAFQIVVKEGLRVLAIPSPEEV